MQKDNKGQKPEEKAPAPAAKGAPDPSIAKKVKGKCLTFDRWQILDNLRCQMTGIFDLTPVHFFFFSETSH